MSSLNVTLTANTSPANTYAVTADGVSLGNTAAYTGANSGLDAIAVGVAKSTATGAANTTTLTVASGSVSATAGYTFTAGAPAQAVNFSPTIAQVGNGGSQTFTYTVEDSSGNPVAGGPTVLAYDPTANTGAWITAVNGTQLSENLGTNGSSVPTPIPLYSSGYSLGYSSVYIPGVASWTSTGTVTLYASASGQVSFTIQNGDVGYWNVTSSVYSVQSSGTGSTTGATYAWTYGANTNTALGAVYLGSNTAPSSYYGSGSTPTQVGQINW